MEKLKKYQYNIINNIMSNMGLARNNVTFVSNILNIDDWVININYLLLKIYYD